jgi:hypothetical protein
VLAQTDGAEIPPAPIPTWERLRALAVLNVTEIPFDETNGNVLGFARGRSIAINPVNPRPYKLAGRCRRIDTVLLALCVNDGLSQVIVF